MYGLISIFGGALAALVILDKDPAPENLPASAIKEYDTPKKKVRGKKNKMKK